MVAPVGCQLSATLSVAPDCQMFPRNPTVTKVPLPYATAFSAGAPGVLRETQCNPSADVKTVPESPTARKNPPR